MENDLKLQQNQNAANLELEESKGFEKLKDSAKDSVKGSPEIQKEEAKPLEATFGVNASQLDVDGNVAPTDSFNMVEKIKAMAPNTVVEQKTFTVSEVNALKETHQLEIQRLKDAHQVEVMSMKKEISKQAGEISVLTEQNKKLTEKNKKLTDEVKALKNQVAELYLHVQTMLAEIADLKHKLAQAGTN